MDYGKKGVYDSRRVFYMENQLIKQGKVPGKAGLQVLIQGVFLLLVFLAFEAFFRYQVTSQVGLWDQWESIFRDAVIYLFIYLLVFRSPLAGVTLSYLLLPYLVFCLGWLAPWAAAAFLSVLAICAWRVYRTESSGTTLLPFRFSWDQALGFCLVIAWVHLSGAGGVGYQADDYNMHNGRLKDLVEYPWPVRYGENQNLIYYVGYYLPAAALGKWLGHAVAYQAMYFWTLLGVSIAFRWVISLTRLNGAVLAALLLVFFGGLDVVGYWVSHYGGIVAGGLLHAPDHDGLLDFWMFQPFGYFIGAYPSNAFQLYWAPHQIIAGWIVGALLLNTCFQNHYRNAGFFYALLALWAPLVMLAAAPLFLMLLFCRGWKGFIDAFSIENLLGGGAILLLFAAFYFSGSAAENPRDWLWNIISLTDKWPLLLLFYGTSWGILAALLWPVVRTLEAPQRRAFGAVVLALLLVSFAWYGLFADMMVRGSALLMFILMIYAGRVLAVLLQQRRWLYAGVLCVVLVLSGLSAHWNITRARHLYGIQQMPVRAPDHGGASQFLGPDESFFQHYLAPRREP